MSERMRGEWARSGHPCGKGSLPENVSKAIESIRKAVKETKAKSVSNVGCGVSDWFPSVPGYQRYDIHKWDDGVQILDAINERVPPCDLIVCRFMLNHVLESDVKKALQLFKESSKALLTTSFPESEDTISGDYWHPNIAKYIGEPNKCYDDYKSILGLWIWR